MNRPLSKGKKFCLTFSEQLEFCPIPRPTAPGRPQPPGGGLRTGLHLARLGTSDMKTSLPPGMHSTKIPALASAFHTDGRDTNSDCLASTKACSPLTAPQPAFAWGAARKGPQAIQHWVYALSHRGAAWALATLAACRDPSHWHGCIIRANRHLHSSPFWPMGLAVPVQMYPVLTRRLVLVHSLLMAEIPAPDKDWVPMKTHGL